MTNPYAGNPSALRVSVNAFVQNNEAQVLLQRRSDNGYWNLPGGGLELGESLERALERETFEETGLMVRALRLIGVYSAPALTVMTYPDGRCLQYVAHVFECRVIGGNLRLDHESLELSWHDPSRLPHPLSPHHRQRISDALEHRQAAFFR